MLITYSDADVAVRGDIVVEHQRAFARLSRAGAWFDGKARLAIAAETRRAPHCELCARQKAALSPFSIAGTHDSSGYLPEPIVEQIHRIVSDPGRLTRTWFESVLEMGTTDAEYVEIVGVIATIVAIDTFCRAIGVPVHTLPAPIPGAPHRRRPKTAHQRGEAWVPLIHPTDLEGPLDTDEERVLAAYWGGMLANIRRALSLVPEEAYAWFQIVETQYLTGPMMREFDREFRAITHAQIELIAGRVSVLNQCLY